MAKAPTVALATARPPSSHLGEGERVRPQQYSFTVNTAQARGRAETTRARRVELLAHRPGSSWQSTMARSDDYLPADYDAVDRHRREARCATFVRVCKLLAMEVAAMSTWRERYKVHPAADVFPMLRG